MVNDNELERRKPRRHDEDEHAGDGGVGRKQSEQQLAFVRFVKKVYAELIIGKRLEPRRRSMNSKARA